MKSKKPIEGEVLPKEKHATKYRPEMCDTIIQVAREGGHVAGMCLAIGIRSRDTFYRWLDEYPEFNEAYQEARLQSQAFYENVLIAGACGKIDKFNFNAIAMIMNNKFPEDFKRGVSGGSNTEINIGSINSIEKLDSDALDAQIAKLQKKLNLVPVQNDGSED